MDANITNPLREIHKEISTWIPLIKYHNLALWLTNRKTGKNTKVKKILYSDYTFIQKVIFPSYKQCYLLFPI